MSKQKPTSESFLVQVHYSDNKTMQGTVLWGSENKTVPFRSGMELLQLMDDAVASREDAAREDV